MGVRRKSREYALKSLYVWEMTRQVPTPDTVFDLSPLSPDYFRVDVEKFGGSLVCGIVTHQDVIDAVIRKYSKHWKLERMATIDRNILRIAIYELLFLKDVPQAVVINEAVEIAKLYGDNDSPQFVNGNLDQICKHEISEDPATPGLQDPKPGFLQAIQ
jgi:N utilization substance protein B